MTDAYFRFQDKLRRFHTSSKDTNETNVKKIHIIIVNSLETYKFKIKINISNDALVAANVVSYFTFAQ